MSSHDGYLTTCVGSRARRTPYPRKSSAEGGPGAAAPCGGAAELWGIKLSRRDPGGILFQLDERERSAACAPAPATKHRKSRLRRVRGEVAQDQKPGLLAKRGETRSA